MVFYRSLSNSKSPQVSRTLLGILADINNTVVWRIPPRPLISKISSSCNNPLVTVPRAPVTIVIIVTFIFHSFFQFPSKLQVLIFLFAFLWFYSVVSQDTKVHNSASSLFFVDYYLVMVVWPRLGNPFVFQNPRGVSLCISFSKTDSWLCISHLFVIIIIFIIIIIIIIILLL